MMQLGVPFKEARRLLNAYHSTRPGIKILNEQIAQTLNSRGYINNLYGRRLHVDTEHKALNALDPRLSAADLCEIA
jgi:DNA polymerase I-like protein with 3'-5' exonuclease and polymerase domains